MTQLNDDARASFDEGTREPSAGSVDEVLAMYREAGFAITDALRRFVAEYEGFRFDHPSAKVEGRERAHLRAIDLDDDLDPEAVADYTDTMGSQMIPVGEAYNGHVMLLLDGSGGLYESYDLHFARLGRDFEDGINAIFERRDVDPIPVTESG